MVEKNENGRGEGKDRCRCVRPGERLSLMGQIAMDLMSAGNSVSVLQS